MEQEKDILNAMGMSDAIKIKCSPDRENIFLSIFHKESSMDVYESYEKIYQPLCDQLLKDGYKFPVTLLYMPLQHLGSASAYCRYIFGNPTLDQCTYGILCSGQNTEVKNTILMDLRKSNPRIRLVFCTSVVGMGFNSPSIDRVIHARPPRNLADYVQEFGRAGRSGQPAEAVLYFCKKDIAANVKDMNTDIIGYCHEEQCLRKYILRQFGFGKSADMPMHKCCLLCKNNCDCFECEILRIEL